MNIEELISQYIDGSLSSEAEAELHHRLAVSPEARQLFRAHIMLRGVARDQRVLHTPTPDVRNRLFDRLVQEEGMKPAAAVPISLALGAEQTSLPPVPTAPPGTSLRQDRPPERRRRRVLPWLIPSLIAGMLLVVVWSSEWGGGPSGTTTVGTTGGDLADGGTVGQGNTAIERVEGTERGASSSGAGEPATGGSVIADQGATDQAKNEMSSPASKAAGNPVGDTSSSALERPGKQMAAYDGARSRTSRAPRSRVNSQGSIASGSGGSLHDFSAATSTAASVQAPSGQDGTREGALAEGGPVLADDMSRMSKSESADDRDAPREISVTSRSSSRLDNMIDSSMRSSRTSLSNSLEMARAEGGGNGRSLRDALQTDVESKQNSKAVNPRRTLTAFDNAATPPVETQSSATYQLSPSSETRLPLSEVMRHTPQDMALSAPPPPPMAMPRVDGVATQVHADSSAVVPEHMASVRLSSAPEPLRAAPIVIAVGLQQNSLVSLTSSDMQLQVLVRAGVEFGDGDHQIFGIVSGGHYQESSSDSLLAVMYNGEIYSPDALVNLGGGGGGGRNVVPGVREEERNELWIGGGYRYSREIAEGWRVGIGVWSGVGEQYLRLASELPVAYQPVRWIRIEILPTVQYTTAYGETKRTTTTEFDPLTNYSERNERTTALVRDNDINLGIGIGASVLW